MNIQNEVQKIHHQYGVTERANYEIQLLCERYAEWLQPKGNDGFEGTIQFKSNTPQIEAFIGKDVIAMSRKTDGNSSVNGLVIEVPQGKLTVSLNDWIIKEGSKYFVLNTDAYVLLSGKQDRLEGIKAMNPVFKKAASVTLSQLNNEAKRRYPYPDGEDISQSLNTADIERSAFINGAAFAKDMLECDGDDAREILWSAEKVIAFGNHLFAKYKVIDTSNPLVFRKVGDWDFDHFKQAHPTTDEPKNKIRNDYWQRRANAAENLIAVMQNCLLVPKKGEAKALAELKVSHSKWEDAKNEEHDNF
jgi:hypothetical protein